MNYSEDSIGTGRRAVPRLRKIEHLRVITLIIQRIFCAAASPPDVRRGFAPPVLPG